MARQKYTPITFENLFHGMKDRGPVTDEKSPNVRKIVNFNVDGNSAVPRGGLQALINVGKPIIQSLAMSTNSGTALYLFTANELFVANGDGLNYGAPVSYGTYTSTDFVDAVVYLRETTLLNSGGVSETSEQFITVTTPIVREEYTGKILKLSSGGNTELISISLNTNNEIEVDGYIEHKYNGSTYQIYDTEKSVHFTAGGNLYRVEGTTVTDTGKNYDFIGTHAGRIFACRESDAKVVFSNTQTLYFPRQQETLFDPGDGKFLGFAKFFENLVVIMEHGIYTIAGQFPEEMIPEKRLAEDVGIAGRKAFASKNGVMYFLTNRGVESFSRFEARAQPQARDISFSLNRERFKPGGLVSDSPMVIYGNRILIQMNGYILVYDTDMSIILQDAWFGEYDNFEFQSGCESKGTTYITSGNKVYAFVDGKTTDDDFGLFTCQVTGNIAEYGQRDIRKLWRDFIAYFTWNSEENQRVELTTSGRNVPEVTESRSSGITDEEAFIVGLESPYMIWTLKVEGDFSLEDIIIWFKPTSALYAKSHVS